MTPARRPAAVPKPLTGPTGPGVTGPGVTGPGTAEPGVAGLSAGPGASRRDAPWPGSVLSARPV
jgi:hypothetical protein